MLQTVGRIPQSCQSRKRYAATKGLPLGSLILDRTPRDVDLTDLFSIADTHLCWRFKTGAHDLRRWTILEVNVQRNKRT